jgi:hypothetical protein
MRSPESEGMIRQDCRTRLYLILPLSRAAGAHSTRRAVDRINR